MEDQLDLSKTFLQGEPDKVRQAEEVRTKVRDWCLVGINNMGDEGKFLWLPQLEEAFTYLTSAEWWINHGEDLLRMEETVLVQSIIFLQFKERFAGKINVSVFSMDPEGNVSKLE